MTSRKEDKDGGSSAKKEELYEKGELFVQYYHMGFDSRSGPRIFFRIFKT
jgi:hypothetical protein